jgi:hypothetical protein
VLLICGGVADPNIQRFVEIASKKVPTHPILIGKELNPDLHWDIQTGRLDVDGQRIEPRAAFLRADVFGSLDDPRAEVGFRSYGWHTTLDGFVRSLPRVRIFNRSHDAAFSKPVQLVTAKKLGLRIPSTVITNSEVVLRRMPADAIAKPVNGGDYCQDLQEVVARTEFKEGRASTPAIVQSRMRVPDLRVYRVGSDFLSFTLHSDALDYRTRTDVVVKSSRNPTEAVLRRLEQLTDLAGLDFAAADFRRSPDSSEWVFLEVNSGPMFAAFDVAAKGRLTSSMVRHLTN